LSRKPRTETVMPDAVWAKSIAATDRLWEHGKLVGCTLKTGAKDAIRKTQGNEAWKTVRELGFDGRPFRPDPESIVPFLAEPVMANLRGLHSLEEKPLAVLLACKEPPQLDRLILHHGQAKWAPCDRFGMHTLGAAMSFESKSLADLPDCVTTFVAREGTVAAWLPELNKAGRHLTRFEMWWGCAYMPVEHYRIVLERTGKKFDRMEVTLRGGGVAMELAGTPVRSFAQITVDGEPASPQTAKALARLGWRAP
jgi:hypothetical protein